MRRTIKTLGALAGLVLAGCTSTRETRLAPAPWSAEDPSRMGNLAVDSSPEVKVMVETGAWPGDPRLGTIVHPLRVRMQHRGKLPVLITYDKFVLLGPLGRRFSALPPYAIRGTLDEPSIEEDFDPIPEPMIVYERFEVSPALHPRLPALPPFAGVIYVDTVRHNHLHRSLARSGLPSRALLERALPEGVLQGGGKLEGFLYFEKVPADIRGVSLVAQFLDSGTGEIMGNVVIPLVVETEDDHPESPVTRGTL